MKYILFIFLLGGYDWPAQIDHIDGFATKFDCERAAKEFDAGYDTEGHGRRLRFLCVRGPEAR